MALKKIDESTGLNRGEDVSNIDQMAIQKIQGQNSRKTKGLTTDHTSTSYVRDISKINEEIENIKKKTSNDKMKLRKSTETKIF